MPVRIEAAPDKPARDWTGPGPNAVDLRGGTGQAKLARDQRTRMGKLRLAHGTRPDEAHELNPNTVHLSMRI